MANFLDLDDAINLYNKVFNLFEFYEKQFQLDIFKIKYEDLVFGFKNQISLLLNFLNLDYESSLEKFHETASKRNIISTPSYNQVINPLYTSSIGRWKKYNNVIEIEKKLDQWLKKLKY